MVIALWRIFCWGTWTHQLQCMGSVVVVHWLSWSWACGIWVPWPGIEPISPALQGRSLTARLPGKFPQTVISFGSFVFSQALKRAPGSSQRCSFELLVTMLMSCLHFFFHFFLKDTIDLEHCVNLRYTTLWFDLHTLWGNDHSKFMKHPSSHIDTKLKKQKNICISLCPELRIYPLNNFRI